MVRQNPRLKGYKPTSQPPPRAGLNHVKDPSVAIITQEHNALNDAVSGQVCESKGQEVTSEEDS